VRSLVVYAVLGACLWLAVLESGIHATIAGVVLALLTPARPQRAPAVAGEEAAAWLDALRESPADTEEEEQALLGAIETAIQHAESPLERLERRLHPWAAFVILPVFALANAGLDVSGGAVSEAARSGVAGGVVVGLLVGKPLGILLFSWLAVRLRLAHLPAGVNWTHIAGTGVVAGVGFTVSLFITGLAFDAGALQEEAKLGIVAASTVAGLAGFLLLRAVDSRP
jgi:NhaA family Na+:H+ antiporter